MRQSFAQVGERLSRAADVSVETAVDRVYGRHHRLFRDLVPVAIEEIDGLAEGAGLTVAEAFVVATGDGIRSLPPAEACTSVACGRAATADGHVLMGQNKDTGRSTDRYHVMCIAYANTGRRMILLNYPGWIANIGLTSDGMCFTSNSLYAREPSVETVPYSLLKRLVLERTSVQQVLDAIDGLTFENGAFQVGDSTGRIASIECVAGQMRVRDVSDGAFGHANSVLEVSLKPYESNPLGSPSSPLRQKNIAQQLNARRGSITTDDLKRILADHADYPLSLCRHACEADVHHSTAAFVADLNRGQIEIAIGNPCAATFRRHDLAA